MNTAAIAQESLELDFDAVNPQKARTASYDDLHQSFIVALHADDDQLGMNVGRTALDGRRSEFNQRPVAANPTVAAAPDRLMEYVLWLNMRVSHGALTAAVSEFAKLRRQFHAIADIAGIHDDGHAYIVTMCLSLGDRNDLLFVAPGDPVAPMRRDHTLAHRAYLLMDRIVNGSLAQHTPHLADCAPAEEAAHAARRKLAACPGAASVADAIVESASHLIARQRHLATRPRRA